MLDGDLVQHFGRNIALDQLLEFGHLGHCGAAEDAGEEICLDHVLGRIGGVELGQYVIVVRPEEGEWGDQCAGRYAGDDLELRSGAGGRPADQNAGAIGAITATAGQRQECQWVLWIGDQPRPVGDDLLEFFLDQPAEVGRQLVAPIADFSKTGWQRRRICLCRHRIAQQLWRAAGGGQRDNNRQHQGEMLP